MDRNRFKNPYTFVFRYDKATKLLLDDISSHFDLKKNEILKQALMLYAKRYGFLIDK